MPTTVTLLGVSYALSPPSPSLCRDLIVAAGTNQRRASIAALALCVSLPPTGRGDLVDRKALRALRYDVLEFAELVDVLLDELAVPWQELAPAARAAFDAVQAAAFPGLVEVVSRADFGAGRGEAGTSSSSASASNTGDTPAGSTG